MSSEKKTFLRKHFYIADSFVLDLLKQTECVIYLKRFEDRPESQQLFKDIITIVNRTRLSVHV